MIKPIAFQIEHFFEQINKGGIEQEKALMEKLIEVTKKIDTVEEKHYVREEMNKESFEKFHAKYTKERDEIREVMGKLTPQISNLKKSIEEGITFRQNSLRCGLPVPLAPKKSSKNCSFPKESSIRRKMKDFEPKK